MSAEPSVGAKPQAGGETRFRLGLTRDLLTPDGRASFGDAALAVLQANPRIDWEYLPEPVDEITPAIASRYDGLYVNSPRVTRESVGGAGCRVRIVARHGVGYDSVDVRALADRGIVVTNTPVAVRRPVAVAALTMIFALAGRLPQKDRLIRAGRWHERTGYMGLGLTSRTLGVIGAGGIGRELLRLAAPFGWKMLAADPYVADADIAALGARKVALDALLAASDFVVATCLLNEQTRHLMNAARFARMKRDAFFVNMARGPIADEAALIDALASGRIAGAGLDVFEREPIAPDNPLLAMDNVILTPHSLCWTDECFDAIAREGLGCIVDFSLGRTPRSVVRAD
ncbi:MAG TPA: NAD(P)-dependent oxidoreductase [Burkholderiaceae bacterium]|nr:NAD(P)-dependent oxidoreductase [Burkholderiaceae bacterium]